MRGNGNVGSDNSGSWQQNPHRATKRTRGVIDRNHPVTAGGGFEGRSVLRQKPPNPSAFHAIGSQRTRAKASHSAHNNMAALYHHNDSDKTQGIGNSPGARSLNQLNSLAC